MINVGDIMINVGDILSTVGVFSTVGDIMSTMGVILSTLGDVQYRGGYHDARGGYHEYREGCSVPWGENLLLFEYPTVLNTPTVLMISLHMYHDVPPRYSNFKGWYPPTVLNTPTVLMISPHVHHDIPHGTEHRTEHPPRYCTHIIQGGAPKL